MYQLDDHMFACFLLGMLHLLHFLPKKLDYRHNLLIFQFNLFEWIMRVNLHLKHFYDYYMLIGINVEHHVAHTQTQNDLA
jgi:hypothetical protein